MCSVGLVYPHRDRYSTNYNTVQHTTSPTGRQTQASVVVLVQNYMTQDPLYYSVINLFSHGSRSVAVLIVLSVVAIALRYLFRLCRSWSISRLVISVCIAGRQRQIITRHQERVIWTRVWRPIDLSVETEYSHDAGIFTHHRHQADR